MVEVFANVGRTDCHRGFGCLFCVNRAPVIDGVGGTVHAAGRRTRGRRRQKVRKGVQYPFHPIPTFLRRKRRGMTPVEQVGGLIGAKGTQIGSGGLRSRVLIGWWRHGHRIGWAGHEGCGPERWIQEPVEGPSAKKGGIATRMGGVSPAIYGLHSDNALTDVLEDPMSTFAADVDTASYTNARRELQSGRLPNVAAVRVKNL